jgi:hypothetical protein
MQIESEQEKKAGTMIISKEIAIEQGLTPGFLRTVANSVERLGKDWQKAIKGAASEQQIKDCRMNADINFGNARSLRRLASEIERAKK